MKPIWKSQYIGELCEYSGPNGEWAEKAEIGAKAFCSVLIRSGLKPRRSNPTPFTPKALFSRRAEVFEKGSTAWVAIVSPPMNAYLPTMQN